MTRPYIPLDRFEHMEHAEHASHESSEMAKLAERQAKARRRNMHNFAQLERAGFPGTMPIDMIYWVNSRLLGRAAKLMGKSVVGDVMATRMITHKIDRGYFVPRSGGGFAITTEGTVYHEADRVEARGAVEVHRAPRRGLSTQRFENPGTALADFKGDDRFPLTRPFASPHEIEKIKVDGTEIFATSFERVTKRALDDAGVHYVPLDEAGSPAPPLTGTHDGITEEMPTVRMPIPGDDEAPTLRMPVVRDEPPTLRMPRVDTPPTDGSGLVNPVEIMFRR